MATAVPSFTPGLQMADGDKLNSLMSLLFGCATGLTAKAGGGQSTAVPLTAAINEVSVCASGNDSVVLPQAQSPGQTVTVINNGAQTLAVFAAAGTDQIIPNNSVTPTVNANAVTLATAKICEFFCYKVGFWKQETTA